MRCFFRPSVNNDDSVELQEDLYVAFSIRPSVKNDDDSVEW